MSSKRIRGNPTNVSAPRLLTFATVRQIMSSSFDPVSSPRPVLLGVTTRGKPYYFLVTDQGIAGWVPLPDFEAVIKSQSEIEAAAEAVAKADEQSPADDKPALITGGEVHRTLHAVKSATKDLERGIK